MPRRPRKSRGHNSRVTDKAVELFTQAEPLTAGRDACTASDDMCTHAECDEHIRLSLALHAELGLGPHQPSPLDVDDEPYEQDGTGWAEAYPMVQELRREILARLGRTR